MNKRGQGGLSMNTIIIAVIAVIVLLLIVTFFVGGMATVFGKIRDVFTGGTAGYDIDLAKSNCRGYCERARLVETQEEIDKSTYCTKAFKIEKAKDNLVWAYCDGSLINTPCSGASCVNPQRDVDKRDGASVEEIRAE